MKGQRNFLAVLASALLTVTSLAQSDVAAAQTATINRDLIELWAAGRPAFGEYVTQKKANNKQAASASQKPASYTVQTGRDLAANSLLDFAFLSLEQHWDADSARNVAQGLRNEHGKSTLPLLVRIPPISVDGVDAARARVKEALALGADGVVIPHVLSAEEARTAVSFFEGVSVWSPDNPQGEVVAMLIIEDPDVFLELEEIADIPGYSALVCGIGSLTSALGGDREAAEAINQQVLAQSQRAGKPNLTTVDAASVTLRVKQGFLGLLAYGPTSNEAIRLGKAAAGR
ncbi:MAG: aldolase/citrate lyase family protein [Congregibacter sp.]